MQSPEPREVDPATLTLDLKVTNPTIVSGHFLVTAVDFLSDNIIELVECVAASDQFKRVTRLWGPGSAALVSAK